MWGTMHHDPEPPHPQEAQTRPNTAQMALATDIHVLMLVKQQNTTAYYPPINTALGTLDGPESFSQQKTTRHTS